MGESRITTETYALNTSAHRLVGSRSADGAEIFFPARSIDPHNPTAHLELVELSGRGTLVTFSIVPVASSEMIAAGYGRDNPHCVGIVRLVEGPAISAQITGVDVNHPEQIRLGIAMEAEFLDRVIGEYVKTVLAFHPV